MIGVQGKLGLCLGWKGQCICWREGKEGNGVCGTEGGEGTEGGWERRWGGDVGEGGEGSGGEGRGGGREGGREGETQREGGREGRGEGEGGMTVIHILIGMFDSNPMIPQ